MAKDAQRTQASNTMGSYEKVINFLIKTYNQKPNRILDYGAGKGNSMYLEFPFNIYHFEPYPKDWNPDYTDVQELLKEGTGRFDFVICLNVLNVLEKEERDESVINIINLLTDKGIAYIGTRAWKGDIENSKTGELMEEEKSKRIYGSYQKGFDKEELREYVSSLTSYTVIRKVIGTKNGVLIIK